MKLVIFDLDGTLVDTLDGITFSLNLVLKQYGFQEKTRNFYRTYIGNGAKNLIKQSIYNGNIELDEDLIDKILDEFITKYHKYWYVGLKQYEGVAILLSELKREGCKIVINTNKPHDIAVKVVEHFYDSNTILSLKGACDDYNKKPSPDAVFLLINEMGISANESIFIGDSIVDIKTAKNAEIKSIVVSWGYGKANDFNEADYIADNCKDILEIIKNKI